MAKLTEKEIEKLDKVEAVPVVSIKIADFDELPEHKILSGSKSAESLAEDALEIPDEEKKCVNVLFSSSPRSRFGKVCSAGTVSLTDDKGARPVWQLIRDMYQRGALGAVDESQYDFPDGNVDFSDDGIDDSDVSFDDVHRMAQHVSQMKDEVAAEMQKAESEVKSTTSKDSQKASQTRENASQSDSEAQNE